MRLIDADVLKEQFSESGAYTCKGVREIIDKAPTVEERPKGNWISEYVEEMGYDGCRNCAHQIAPLRRCEWAERGGDGKIHIVCPMWDKKEGNHGRMDSN